MRIQHPMLSPRSNKTISFSFNYVRYEGLEGDTVAIALWANGVKALRISEKNNEPRGMYCGIGQCYECRIHQSKQGLVKACTTTINEGDQFFSSES
ncbi:(2Fe-2S)-binding protein [Peribacillus alkalitolerans]|uniref:(2Fe-2S)-binding protein n=1 Tax=Peribacillus alkalitolerans TaxID=1550385 RepID=UPI0013CF9848|nr:(2Fe-2S)-binding protein [Peribacillus alkalitolerans]